MNWGHILKEFIISRWVLVNASISLQTQPLVPNFQSYWRDLRKQIQPWAPARWRTVVWSFICPGSLRHLEAKLWIHPSSWFISLNISMHPFQRLERPRLSTMRARTLSSLHSWIFLGFPLHRIQTFKKNITDVTSGVENGPGLQRKFFSSCCSSSQKFLRAHRQSLCRHTTRLQPCLRNVRIALVTGEQSVTALARPCFTSGSHFQLSPLSQWTNWSFLTHL